MMIQFAERHRSPIGLRAARCAVTVLAVVAVLLASAPATQAFQQGKLQPTKPQTSKPQQAKKPDPKAAAPTLFPKAKAKTVVLDGPTPLLKCSEPLHNFGEQWVGPQLEHTFVIKNEGTATLNITKVRPACGCTIADRNYPRQLAPGESGNYSFKLNSTKLRGAFTKPITITSNDPVNPTFKLTLKGTVKRFVDVKPTTANFGRISGDEATERVLTIQNNMETPLELTVPETRDGSPFTYELVETTPGKTFELHVRTVPPYKPGTLRETIKIGTNVEAQKTLDVRIHGTVPERLDIQPKTITVVAPRGNKRSTGRPVTRLLRFNNYGKRPVKLLEATVDNPDITATITENKPGKSYNVQVRMPAGFVPTDKGNVLTLKTDDPDIPELTIPIRAPLKKSARAPGRPIDKMVGKPAPDFTTTTTAGKTLTAADMKDTITVLDFFAPNCPHCKKQIPKLEKVRQEYEAKGVRFVLVSQTFRNKRYTDEDVIDLVKELGSHSELVLDHDNTVGPKFKATIYPSMVLVGKKGTIEAVNVGNSADLETRLKKQLDAMIAGKPVPQTKRTAAKPRRRPALDLVGKAAPAFSIETLEGKTVSNSDFAEHPATILNFVAPNCGFCKRQVPTVDKVRAVYESKGVRFVNIVQKMRKNYDQDAMVDIFKKAGSNLEIANDMATNQVGGLFKAVSYPTLFVVGKNGKVEAVSIGAKKDLEQTLKTQLDTLIAGKSLVDSSKAKPVIAPQQPKRVNLTPVGTKAKSE